MKKIKITYWGKRLIKVQLEQNNWTEVWLRFYLHPGGVWWIKSRIHGHRVIEMWWVVASDQHNWTSAQQQQLIRLNTHTHNVVITGLVSCPLTFVLRKSKSFASHISYTSYQTNRAKESMGTLPIRQPKWHLTVISAPIIPTGSVLETPPNLE